MLTLQKYLMQPINNSSNKRIYIKQEVYYEVFSGKRETIGWY